MGKSTSELKMKLGYYKYDGNGKLLERDTEYAVFEVGNEVEAYPEGESEPVTMNKGTFASLQSGNLEKTEGYTPQR